jgi:hypothetical protein
MARRFAAEETDFDDRFHASPIEASQEAARSSHCTAIVRRMSGLTTAEAHA